MRQIRPLTDDIPSRGKYALGTNAAHGPFCGQERAAVPRHMAGAQTAGYGRNAGACVQSATEKWHLRNRGGELTIGPDMTQTDGKPFVLTGGYWFYDNEVEAAVLASRIAQAGDPDPERVITGFIREGSDRLDESGVYNPVGGKILFERIGK